jgi:hypothetical protein
MQGRETSGPEHQEDQRRCRDERQVAQSTRKTREDAGTKDKWPRATGRPEKMEDFNHKHHHEGMTYSAFEKYSDRWTFCSVTALLLNSFFSLINLHTVPHNQKAKTGF